MPIDPKISSNQIVRDPSGPLITFYLSILCVVLCYSSGIIHFITGHQVQGLISVSIGTLFALSILIYKRGFRYAPIFILLILSNCVLLVFSALAGETSALDRFFIFLAGIPFLLLQEKVNWARVFSFISLVFYCVLHGIIFNFNLVPIEWHLSTSGPNRYFNVFVPLFAQFLMVSFFERAHSKSRLSLRVALEELEKSKRDQEVLELQGSFAHEINNPLTVVLGKVHKLKASGRLNVDDHRELKTIETACARISDLVQKISTQVK